MAADLTTSVCSLTADSTWPIPPSLPPLLLSVVDVRCDIGAWRHTFKPLRGCGSSRRKEGRETRCRRTDWRLRRELEVHLHRVSRLPEGPRGETYGRCHWSRAGSFTVHDGAQRVSSADRHIPSRSGRKGFPEARKVYVVTIE